MSFGEKYSFTIDGGDLQQRAVQRDFLRHRGLDVGESDVYPALRTEEDRVTALQCIWDGKPDGWWNLKADFVANGVCTREEFRAALEARNARGAGR